MIRPFKTADLPFVLDIWLSANLSAHSFIPARYWQAHLPQVAEALPQAEIFVLEEEGAVQGFIGLSGQWVEGLFVAEGARGRGVGRLLMEQAKAGREMLELEVYQKNQAARRFYQREGFFPAAEVTDPGTGEAALKMRWRRR